MIRKTLHLLVDFTCDAGLKVGQLLFAAVLAGCATAHRLFSSAATGASAAREAWKDTSAPTWEQLDGDGRVAAEVIDVDSGYDEVGLNALLEGRELVNA